MITDDLFERVLVEPFEPNSILYIVSGYASATMVSRHFSRLIRNQRRRAGFIRRQDVRIELIVGMAVQDGISAKDHEGFQEIAKEYEGLFVCRYVAYRPPVHSKSFAWYRNDTPQVGFTGSANYTQKAFSSSQREVVIRHDAKSARSYFDLIYQDTVDCSDENVSELITIYDEPRYSMSLTPAEDEEEDEAIDQGEFLDDLANLPHERVTLLDNRGRLPQRSGLNWGQRPEEGREPNQAYIRLPVALARTDFFPPRYEHFTIITDDDRSLICVRAQDQAKAIHTPDSNSRMGLYFRHRLGLQEGSPVELEDLERYGRTNVDFYKIDEETYYMDFSV